MSIKKMLAAAFLLLFTLSGRSQAYDYPTNETALRALQQEIRAENALRNNRVQLYLQDHPADRRSFRINGRPYYLYDIVNGRPQYLTTDDETTAQNLGMTDLRPGGKFGLNITGKGIRVAVWDAGIARRTHQEYADRLLNNDSGTDVDDHACHVVGTMIGAGIQPEARGILYEAQASAYDWIDDFEEMISESLDRDLLLSNHSYGFPGGWSDGMWLGDASISNEEDYRFGFYGSRARTVDNMAFNAPYYSIFKSAGNDRGDSGPGVQPPDGPFDCISDWGVAKNVFTIGAVRKLNGPYTSPQDVVMSSFSSWGPVDDGRIKPDLVAPGVGLFSALSDADDAYGNLSGTSFSSPSAAGAVMAVNEAYRLFHGTYLRSATLKALTIQTALEAGGSPGPDYSFGWGLLDASGAVDLISRKDEVNTFVIESSLLNKDSFVLELNPIAGEKITATIAWTDPSGNPVPAALDPTDLMIVNDLDMRIRDEVGNQTFPWTLDPTGPGKPAARRDNFRDNVEKIEFNNPQPRRYFLVVKHKGDLRNGKQDFSLVLQYTSESVGLENLYWVNNNGNWSNTGRWSASSGGNTSNLSPQSNSKLIFDNNSFSNANNTVTIDQDYEVAGIVSLNDKKVTFDLGGNTLTVSGSVVVGSPNFTITNGTIVLKNEDATQNFNIDLDQTKTNNLDIVISEDNAAGWTIANSEVAVTDLSVQGGHLTVNNSELTLSGLSIGAGAIFDLVRSRIEDPASIQVDATAFWSDDFQSTITVGNTGTPLSLRAPVAMINAALSISNNTLSLEGSGMSLDKITLNSARLQVQDDIMLFNLTMSAGSSLELSAGKTIELSQSLTINSTATERVQFTSPDSGNRGTFLVTPHQKYCFDFLDITNIDLAGTGSVSIGNNSTLSAADNWFAGACNELLFADFSVQYACVGSLGQFTNLSDGDITTYQWYVDGVEAGNEANIEYLFEEAGDYVIRLEISNDQANVASWEQSVGVVESEIPDNRIIQNPTQLASLNLADSYQWYRNGEPIPGATGRVYIYNGEAAVYWVVTFDGPCNKQSEVLDLLGTPVQNLDRDANNLLDIYPVPAGDELFLVPRNDPFKTFHLKIYNAFGQAVYQADLGPASAYRVDLSSYIPGVYLLVMDVGDRQILTKKIIKHD